MGEELGCHGSALTFLSAYLDFLPQRLATFCAAVLLEDTAAAMDRVLSLKVSSTMVGAARLAALAEVLQGLVCTGNWAAAEPLLEVLDADVAAVLAAGRAAVGISGAPG
ncbi:Hpt domain-containing protein [Pseudarthrobacter equi]|nr:Hpt domain-containing protein [Pseudarthrobacter equi]